MTFYTIQIVRGAFCFHEICSEHRRDPSPWGRNMFHPEESILPFPNAFNQGTEV